MEPVPRATCAAPGRPRARARASPPPSPTMRARPARRYWRPPQLRGTSAEMTPSATRSSTRAASQSNASSWRSCTLSSRTVSGRQEVIAVAQRNHRLEHSRQAIARRVRVLDRCGGRSVKIVHALSGGGGNQIAARREMAVQARPAHARMARDLGEGRARVAGERVDRGVENGLAYRGSERSVRHRVLIHICLIRDKYSLARLRFKTGKENKRADATNKRTFWPASTTRRRSRAPQRRNVGNATLETATWPLDHAGLVGHVATNARDCRIVVRTQAPVALGNVVGLALARTADGLSVRCSRGAPPKFRSAPCNPCAYAVKLSSPGGRTGAWV